MTSSSTLDHSEGFTPPPVITAVTRDIWRDRVTIAETPAWVSPADIDWNYSPHQGGSISLIWIDEQWLAPRHEYYYRLVRRLETIQAVQDSAQWRLSFDPKTQHITIHSLHIRRGDRVIEKANLEAFQCLQREQNLEQLVLDGTLDLMLIFDDVRPGDIMDISYTIKTEPRLFKHNFSLIIGVSFNIPLRTCRYIVHFEKNRQMDWKSNARQFTPIVHESAETTSWEWRRDHPKPIEYEWNTPNDHFYGAWVQVSDYPDWATVARGHAEAWAQQSETAEVDAFLAKISDPTMDRPALLEKVLRAIQDDVRYLSVNTTLGGRIPTDPDTVLKRSYGDCKDKSHLLALALKKIGYEASPVLVNTFWKERLDQFLPSPSFNHAIIEYQLEDGPRYVDATISYQGGGIAHRHIHEYGLGLKLSDQTTTLVPIASFQKVETSFTLKEKIIIGGIGAPSRAIVTLTTTGVDADYLRSFIVNASALGVGQRREKFMQGWWPSLKLSQTPHYEDDREKNELTIKFLFDLHKKQKRSKDGRVWLLTWPSHLLLETIARNSKENTRNHPFALNHPNKIRHVIEISAPQLPQLNHQNVKVKEKEFTFSLDLTPKDDDGVFRAIYTYETLTPSVTAERYPTYAKAVQKFIDVSNIDIHIPRKSEQSASKRFISFFSKKDQNQPPSESSNSDLSKPQENELELDSSPISALKENKPTLRIPTQKDKKNSDEDDADEVIDLPKSLTPESTRLPKISYIFIPIFVGAVIWGQLSDKYQTPKYNPSKLRKTESKIQQNHNLEETIPPKKQPEPTQSKDKKPQTPINPQR